MFADIIVAILLAVVGLVFIFAGYRFFLLLLPFWGFLTGFWVGASAITAIFGDGFLATIWGWLSGVLVGLVFAALSYLFYWLAITIFSMSIGASIGTGLMGSIGVDARVITFVVAAAFALALAALVLIINLPKILIVCLSAIAGATSLIAAPLLLFNQIQRSDLYHGAALAVINDSLFWLLVWTLLMCAGIMVQMFSTSNFTIQTPEPPLSAQA
jgi:hypothetical protein